MVQDFAKRVPFASNREPKLGQVFLLFLCGRRDTGALEPARQRRVYPVQERVCAIKWPVPATIGAATC